MQRLPLKMLEPKMVVARNVMGENKTVLVSENTELTSKLIFRLENMKVKSVTVKGCPVQLADYIPKTLDQKLAIMNTAFSRVGDDLTMKKFRVLLKSYFIKKDEETRAQDSKPPSKDEAKSEPADD